MAEREVDRRRVFAGWKLETWAGLRKAGAKERRGGVLGNVEETI